MSRRAGVLGAVAVIAVVALGISNASAASLTLVSAKLGAVTVADRCATAALAVTVAGTSKNGTYTQVSIANVPVLCSGKAVRLTLFSSSGATSIVEFVGAITASTPVTLTLPRGTTYLASNVVGAALTIGGYGVSTTWTGPFGATCVVIGVVTPPISSTSTVTARTTQTCSVTSSVVNNVWSTEPNRIAGIQIVIHNNSTDTILWQVNATLGQSPLLAWSPQSLDTYGNLDLVSGCPLGATIGLTGPASKFYSRILDAGGNATLSFQAYEDTAAPIC